jgi:dihydrofolate reductase
VVASRTLAAADWNNSTVERDDIGAKLRRLKAEGEGDLYLFGSANLSETLMRQRLFDEYRIGVAPVIAGRGRRLFADGMPQEPLDLVRTWSTATGCAVLHYRPRPRP